MSSLRIEEIPQSRFEDLTATLAVVPIEQSVAWTHFSDAIDGYKHEGFFLATDNQKPVCVFSLVTITTRGGTYAWLRHGPVWLNTPDTQTEKIFISALKTWVKTTLPQVIWVHLDIINPDVARNLQDAYGVVPYDQTVVIDLSSDESLDLQQRVDEVLTRFKKRGRRDVRKALRESGLEFRDETEKASRDFTPYHAIMTDTSSRDGFIPWTAKHYASMLNCLGADHARLYAGYINNKLTCWSIVTMNGTRATRYYAASSTAVMHKHANDVMVYMECKELISLGMTEYDLMGIGSPASPTLNGLNVFKTKFSQTITTVPLMHALVIKPVRFALYKFAHNIKSFFRK